MSNVLPKNRFKNSVFDERQQYNKTKKDISFEILNSLEYDLIFQMYEKEFLGKINTKKPTQSLKNVKKHNKQR